MDEPKKIATVGYHPQKGVSTFFLRPGQALPAGWSDKPHPGQHPHDDEREKPSEGEEAGVSRR